MNVVDTTRITIPPTITARIVQNTIQVEAARTVRLAITVDGTWIERECAERLTARLEMREMRDATLGTVDRILS